MNYGKITTGGGIMTMPNPITLKFSNPTDEKKALIAELDNWLEMVYTEQPPYDPETETLRQWWEAEEIEGVTKAVQHWEVVPIEPPESETETE